MTHKQEESHRVSPRNEGSEPHIRASNLGPAPGRWAPKMPALKTSISVVQEIWGLWGIKTILLKVVHKISHTLSPSPEAEVWKVCQTHLLILEHNPRKQKAVRNPPGAQTLAAAISRISILVLTPEACPTHQHSLNNQRGLLRQPSWEHTFPHQNACNWVSPQQKEGCHSYTHKSINILHQNNKMKDKICTLISIDAEKAFEQSNIHLW